MAKGLKNSIENMYNRMLIHSLLLAIVTIIVGIILFFMPHITNKVVGIITGMVFLVAGVNSVYKYFHRDGAKLYSLNLVFGILYAILGSFIIIYPFRALEFVTVCLGIYIMVNGSSKINYALWLRKGSEETWLITLVTGILLVTLGILVIFNPFESILTLTKLTGAFLILTGILDFMDTLLFKKRSKEIMEIFW